MKGVSCKVHGSGILTRWLLENDLVDETIQVYRPAGRPRYATA
ncbi:hypothetical protein [Nonomuraea sp. NPDC050786]